MASIEIEFDDEHSQEETLEYVLGLIKQGYTSGYQPTWSIKE